MSIIIDYPGWFIFLCISAGIIYASALYLRDRQSLNWHPALKITLALLRFAAVTILCLFLLKPLIKSTERVVEKPIVVIAQDNSSSLLLSSDSSYYKAQYLTALSSLQEELSEEFEVQTYAFGAEVENELSSIDYEAPASDFGRLKDIITTNYSNRNLGAIVLASDGLYNRGVNPLYAFSEIKAPIFTVAMGDTSARKDVLISEVRNNRLAYLGNRFPIEIQVDTKELVGENANIQIIHNGEKVFSENFSIEQKDQQFTFSAILEAKQSGLQRYRILINPLSGELSTENNQKDVFIEVLDSRQRILILSASVHPDISAIRKALSSSDSYEITVNTLEEFEGGADEYNLVILHQLPNGSSESKDLINRLSTQSIPLFFISGKQTDRTDFNALTTGIELGPYLSGYTAVGAEWSEGFSLFKTDEELKSIAKKMPPLASPASDVQSSAGAQSLFFRKVGMINTQEPLLSFFQGTEGKMAVLSGEGIWRWRLLMYAETGSHDLFNSLWVKSAQYLAAKEDKRKFRLQAPREILETDRLLFEAELYNASYEPVTDGEVSINLVSENGEDYPFTFSKSMNAYRLDAGRLPVGEYSYIARATRNKDEYTEQGVFVIKPLLLEQTRSQADHNLLYQIAQKSGAEMIQASEIDGLAQKIRSNTSLSSTSYEQSKLSDLIQLKWILFLILGLLSFEWLLRKRNGSY